MANGRQVVYPSGGGGSGGAPTTAAYILETANGSLPNAFALGTLATGVLKNTTTTGVPSIATGADLNTAFGSQSQNLLYASPNGSSGNPAFRAMVSADIPASVTLTTPTIADFTNANHSHQNAAGGGTLSAAAIGSGTLALARGGTNADLSATGAANSFLKQSSSGAAITVGTIASADINTALTTPGPIGGTTANTGAFTTLSGLVTDAATATVTDIVTIGHNSSGTPAISFGTGIKMQGQSSTTAARDMAHIYTDWSTATDANRSSTIKFAIFNIATETLVMTIAAGAITLADAKHFAFNTVTGTKIGTATNQKLSLWNATPIVQPTTAVAAAAFVANTSGIANDTATWGGYTAGQVVQALKNIGALA